MCVKLMKVVHFKIMARRVNMCYLARENMELVLNEGLDLEDFQTVVLKRTLLILARSLCQ